MATRAAILLAMMAALVVVGAPPASAHLAGGPEPSNYSARITGVRPELPGVSVSTQDNGDRLEITNASDVPVIVQGTEGEDFLRIGPDGVQRNRNSPLTYTSGTRGGLTSIPPDVDPQAGPRWETVSTAPVWRWYDQRIYWIGDEPPPGVRAHPDHRQQVLAWTVAVSYGDQPAAITGTLTWNPPPPAQWWWTYCAVLAILAGMACIVRSWRVTARLGVAVLVAADVTHLAISTFPTDPTQDGSTTFTIVAAAVPTVTAALLALLAWRSIAAGTGAGPYALGLASWLIVIVGMSDLNVLWTSQLPVNGPGWLTRVAVATSVGLGAGLGAGAFVLIRRQTAALAAATDT